MGGARIPLRIPRLPISVLEFTKTEVNIVTGQVHVDKAFGCQVSASAGKLVAERQLLLQQQRHLLLFARLDDSAQVAVLAEFNDCQPRGLLHSHANKLDQVLVLA